MAKRKGKNKKIKVTPKMRKQRKKNQKEEKSMTQVTELQEFWGRLFTEITINGDKTMITFISSNGDTFTMYHQQDCCEDVHLAEIVGEIDWLLNLPIKMAECVTEEGENDGGVYQWTFYKIGTEKGVVTFRWYGESNGYYSIEVDIEKNMEVMPD